MRLCRGPLNCLWLCQILCYYFGSKNPPKMRISTFWKQGAWPQDPEGQWPGSWENVTEGRLSPHTGLACIIYCTVNTKKLNCKVAVVTQFLGASCHLLPLAPGFLPDPLNQALPAAHLDLPNRKANFLFTQTYIPGRQHLKKILHKGNTCPSCDSGVLIPYHESKGRHKKSVFLLDIVQRGGRGFNRNPKVLM